MLPKIGLSRVPTVTPSCCLQKAIGKNEISVFACQFKESLKFSQSLSCVINKGLTVFQIDSMVLSRDLFVSREVISKISMWMDSLSWRVSSNAMR